MAAKTEKPSVDDTIRLALEAANAANHAAAEIETMKSDAAIAAEKTDVFRKRIKTVVFGALGGAEEDSEAEDAAPAAEEPRKPSFDASALYVLSELGGDDDTSSEGVTEDQADNTQPENNGLEANAPLAEASKATAEKSEPAALDPSALDMLGALGGSDADASVEEGAESATSAKINSSPKASETDLSNSFAMLSDLSSMTDTDEGETLPGTEET